MSNERLNIKRLCFTGGAILVALMLGACANPIVKSSRIAPLLDQESYHVEEYDLQAISPEMEAFLDKYAPMSYLPDKRVWSLAWAVTDRNLLPFLYDPNLNLDSVQAFSLGRGNCLAFSNMLVAMARNRGLKAWYQEVEIPPTWSSTNNTVLVSMHINVVLKGKNDQWVIDIIGENPGLSRKIRTVDDKEALAQYYNNLGASGLTEGNLSKAYAYYVKAIETAPQLAFLWSNLGVAYNRNGQTEDARRAYLTALEMDPGHSIAANNLYLIYQKEGNLEAAQELQAQVDRHRRRNPYYLYYLSSQAAEEGRYEDSSDMLRKAIRMNEKEYRFYYELARLQVLSGDWDAAQANLDHAVQLAPMDSPIGSADVKNLPALTDY